MAHSSVVSIGRWTVYMVQVHVWTIIYLWLLTSSSSITARCTHEKWWIGWVLSRRMIRRMTGTSRVQLVSMQHRGWSMYMKHSTIHQIVKSLMHMNLPLMIVVRVKRRSKVCRSKPKAKMWRRQDWKKEKRNRRRLQDNHLLRSNSRDAIDGRAPIEMAERVTHIALRTLDVVAKANQ